jgi:hypothetical protein
VFDIADSLLGKLASYIYEEASRAYGVLCMKIYKGSDIISIVRGLLLDADEKKRTKSMAYVNTCKLLFLQVLSLGGCCTSLETLPKGFGKLVSLRQLYITTTFSELIVLITTPH